MGRDAVLILRPAVVLALVGPTVRMPSGPPTLPVRLTVSVFSNDTVRAPTALEHSG